MGCQFQYSSEFTRNTCPEITRPTPAHPLPALQHFFFTFSASPRRALWADLTSRRLLLGLKRILPPYGIYFYLYGVACETRHRRPGRVPSRFTRFTRQLNPLAPFLKGRGGKISVSLPKLAKSSSYEAYGDVGPTSGYEIRFPR